MKKNTEVDKFLELRKHPLTEEIRRVREIILETDARVDEVIKWSSPTFTYKGNIASFLMNAKGFVSLMFHRGALLAGKSRLLEGDGKDVRVVRFDSMRDIQAKKGALQALIKEWIKIQDKK
jgi:hypothetical protein